MKYSNRFVIPILGLFALIAISSALFNGLPGGNDLSQHYQFAITIHDSLIAGNIYPSFAPEAANGLGNYGIRFYPPLAYYALSVLFMLFGNWYVASLSLFTIVFWLGAIGIFLWAKEGVDPKRAFIAATIFTFAPHHLNQIYNNFLFAEFVASAIIPFCFLFLTRVCKRGEIRDILGLALSISLLVLTHLPSTILCFIAFGIYSLVFVIKSPSKTRLAAKLSISCLLSLAATSFYWIKLVSELEWINHSSVRYFSGIFSYQSNFLLHPRNILNFRDDVLALWLGDLMLLAILFLSIPALVFLIREKKKLSTFNMANAAVLITAVFLTTPLSKFVWAYLPFLNKIQFPWRWLGIISICGAVFAATGIAKSSELMQRSNSKLLPIGLGVIMIFFVVVSTMIVKQAIYIARSDFPNESVNQLSSASGCECWWTVWTKGSSKMSSRTMDSENRNVVVNQWEQKSKTLTIGAGDKSEMIIAIYYYPHWQVYINGIKKHPFPSEKGLLGINLPKDKTDLMVVFEEPLELRIAGFVSVIAWLVLIIGLVATKIKWRKQLSLGN